MRLSTTIKNAFKTIPKQNRGFLGILCLAFLLVFALLDSVHADELVMKNGDRLQGKIISMEAGELVFETPYAGQITIAWDQVARLTSEDTLEITLPDEETLKGKVVTSEDGSIVLEPETGPPSKPIDMAEVKTMSPPKPPEGWKFTGRASAGADIERGNTDTDKYNIDLELGLYKFPHRFHFYWEYNLERAKGVDTADNTLANFDYNRFISDKWYAFANLRSQRDKFQQLDLLASLAAGVGHQFWKSDLKNLTIKVGPAYVRQHFTEPQPAFDGKDTINYAAGFWAFDFDMWFFKKHMQFFHHNDLTVSFDDTQNWRLITRTGIRVPLVYHLFTSIQYNYDYNNLPAEGTLEYDSRLLFKLGWQY